MKTVNKIQSFTLSEMIVVLILTSIVVGLAFSVLGLVQKQMLAIQSNYNKTLEINKLQTSLWLDFNKYSKIEYNNLENKLKFSSVVDSVNYQFLTDKIIKGRDTFTISIKQIQYYFEGENLSNGQIDALKIETSKAFQNQQLFVFKQNSANAHMN